jgi:alkanesulfonate monooxygenase SsuD/methylene tetrahydromethanopterin reductase-like flavin-dependent oxidoreductase (luciferase family)
MWGVDEWSRGERSARFAEYVDLVDRLTREPEVSYQGRWYRATGSAMAPGFVQRPRPPLVLAAHGPRTIAVAARFADTWNSLGPTLGEAAAQSRLLSETLPRLRGDLA